MIFLKATNGKKRTLGSPRKDGEHLEFSFITGWNAKWDDHFGKRVWQFLIKLNLHLHMTLPFHTKI